MRNWLIAFIAAASCVISLGLLAVPVGAASISTTAVSDNAPVVFGGTLVFTATVSGSGGTPTGAVTWTGVTCSSSTALTAGVATCSISNAVVGTYSATATYGGDSNFSGSSNSDTATVSAAPSTTTVTDNGATVSTGGTLIFTATITSLAGTPAGAVTWTGVTCSSSTALTAGVATCSISNAQAGTAYNATASFTDADGNYLNSSGSAGPVSPAAASSATTVTDNSGLVVTGGTLIFTATVAGPGGTPAGAVTWTGVTCSSSTALTAGVATCSIALAQASIAYSATATFTDTDGNYSGSSGSAAANVGKANPTAPTITNLPSGGTFGGNFTAGVFTANGDGVLSVTSSTPAVCTAAGLIVGYVGVGTCSLNAQVAAGLNYTAASGAAQTFNIGRANATTPVISNIPSPANEFAGFTVRLATTGDGTMSVASNTSTVCSVDPNGITVTFVGFGTCSLTPSVAQGPNHFGATGNPQTFTVKAASHGYWLVGSDGGIFSFGTAAFFGSTGSIHLQRPVVGITPTSTRNGYWLVASDGGIFSFGDSSFYGSIPGIGLHPAGSGLPNSLNAPIVGMVPTLTGRGYFMVASDGGVFSFGDARFEGSCPGIGGCSGPAVTVIPDHSGNGYWVVTANGGVYAFGDAPFYGSGPPVAVSVVDAVATPNGNGYWLLYANGAVAAFGAATALGGPIGYVNSFNPATAIFRTADGFGYWVAAARGDVFGYGSAPYLGGMSAAGLNGEIIAAFGF